MEAAQAQFSEAFFAVASYWEANAPSSPSPRGVKPGFEERRVMRQAIDVMCEGATEQAAEALTEGWGKPPSPRCSGTVTLAPKSCWMGPRIAIARWPLRPKSKRNELDPQVRRRTYRPSRSLVLTHQMFRLRRSKSYRSGLSYIQRMGAGAEVFVDLVGI